MLLTETVCTSISSFRPSKWDSDQSDSNTKLDPRYINKMQPSINCIGMNYLQILRMELSGIYVLFNCMTGPKLFVPIFYAFSDPGDFYFFSLIFFFDLILLKPGFYSPFSRLSSYNRTSPSIRADDNKVKGLRKTKFSFSMNKVML